MCDWLTGWHMFGFGCLQTFGKLEDAFGPGDGDEGRRLGLHVKLGDRSYNFVVSYLPTHSAPMATQARSTCFSDGTDIIDKLPSHTLGGLIIGEGFQLTLGSGRGGTWYRWNSWPSPQRLRAKNGSWKNCSG